jgi:hypothetical protein
MATRIQTETTTRTRDQHPTTDTATDGDGDRTADNSVSSNDSWTSRCGAPATYDPASHASMGQFDTTADEH